MKKYILTGLLVLGSSTSVFAATQQDDQGPAKTHKIAVSKASAGKTSTGKTATSKTLHTAKKATVQPAVSGTTAAAKAPAKNAVIAHAHRKHSRHTAARAATAAVTATTTAATTTSAAASVAATRAIPADPIQQQLASEQQTSNESQTGAQQAAGKPQTQPAPRNDAPAADTRELRLASTHAMIVDANSGQAIYSKDAGQQVPIASVTKLMTAMVVLDGQQSLTDTLRISDEDVDHFKNSSSRLRVNTAISRHDMLHLALMSSENRAASALSRYYPGGKKAFVAAMQKKAMSLGMTHSHFVDPTGLFPNNQSTAEDLVKMVRAAYTYPLIRQFTTTANREMKFDRQPMLAYKNTNALVRGGEWDILVSKTGFTQEAGHCLVMMANVAQRPTVMVFLESQGKLSPVGDATRVKNWMESSGRNRVASAIHARNRVNL